MSEFLFFIVLLDFHLAFFLLLAKDIQTGAFHRHLFNHLANISCLGVDIGKLNTFVHDWKIIKCMHVPACVYLLKSL